MYSWYSRKHAVNWKKKKLGQILKKKKKKKENKQQINRVPPQPLFHWTSITSIYLRQTIHSLTRIYTDSPSLLDIKYSILYILKKKKKKKTGAHAAERKHGADSGLGAITTVPTYPTRRCWFSAIQLIIGRASKHPSYVGVHRELQVVVSQEFTKDVIAQEISGVALNKDSRTTTTICVQNQYHKQYARG